MAQPIYTLTINDGPVIDSETGRISVIEKVQTNQGTGHLKLKIARRPDQDFLFGDRTDNKPDIVTVFANGVRIFRGLSQSPVATISPNDFGHLHTILDMWASVKGCPFRTVSARPTQGAFSNSMWTMLKAFTDSVCANHFALGPWNNNLTVCGYAAWPGINGHTDESIKVLLRPSPYAATSWDYSGPGVPLLRVTNRYDVSMTLDGTDNNISDIDLKLNRDNIPSSVELLSSDLGAGGDNGYYDFLGEMPGVYPLQFLTGKDTLYPDGAQRGQYGSLTMIDPGGNFNMIANGAAGHLYTLLAQAVWVGTFKIKDGTCSTGIFPGMTLNFTGNHYKDLWADAGAVAQTVHEDFLTGVTSVTVGQGGGMTPQTAWERSVMLTGGRAWATIQTNLPFQVGVLPGVATPIIVPQPGCPGDAYIISSYDNGAAAGGMGFIVQMTVGFVPPVGSNICQIFFNVAAPQPADGATVCTITPLNALAISMGLGFTNDSTSMMVTGNVAAGVAANPGQGAFIFAFTVVIPNV